MRSVAPWARVIVVNHNAGSLLQDCADALAAQTLADFEAVIVDNASLDGSIEALSLPDDRFRVVLARANLGFAAANNLAASDCGTDWIITLNPDAEPRKDWLEQLRRASVRYPDATMFGSTQIDARRQDRVDGFGDVYSIFGTAWRGASGQLMTTLPDGDRDVFGPCAAAALYAREAFLAAGGFDESFFCYLEDVDLGFRLRLRGERCVQVRRAEVLHVGSAIAGADSDFFIFHSQRNRLWLMAKNVPSPLIWLVILLQVAVVPLVLLRRGIAGWRPALKGLLAGLRGLPGALRQRRQVQSGRVRSNRDIARMLVWDPRKALRHAPHFIESGLAERQVAREA